MVVGDAVADRDREELCGFVWVFRNASSHEHGRGLRWSIRVGVRKDADGDGTTAVEAFLQIRRTVHDLCLHEAGELDERSEARGERREHVSSDDFAFDYVSQRLGVPGQVVDVDFSIEKVVDADGFLIVAATCLS